MKKMLIDTVISMSIALAALFVLELVLRVLYPEKVLEIAQDRMRIENVAYRIHPDYLVALRPNVRKHFVRSKANGGDVIDWMSNGDSFRGPELRHDPDLRVIVYGDSNVQARFSTLSRTFPFKLQKYLGTLSKRDVEAINAGIIGAGPDQALIRFAADADIYRPDIVVFLIFADNDFGDIVRNRLFELNAEGALVRTRFNAPVDLNSKSIYPRLLVTRAAQKVLKLVTGENVKAPPLILQSPDKIVDRWMELVEEEYAVYKQRRRREFSPFADHYDVDISVRPNSESALTKIALMERVLAKAKTTADEKNVKFLVLILPSSRDLTQNEAMNYKVLQQYPEYRRERLTTVVDEICAKNDILRINLYPVFNSNNPRSLYFQKDDEHWNDAGQKLAARVTADFIYTNMLARKNY